MQFNQLVVIVCVVTHDSKPDVVSSPLPPGRIYDEIRIQQLSINNKPIGRPRVYFTSIPEEDENCQDETESKGRRM